jgi:hypothetical protein
MFDLTMDVSKKLSEGRVSANVKEDYIAMISAVSMALLVLASAMASAVPAYAATAASSGPLINVDVATNPIQAHPGEDGYVELLVQNSGSGTASNIKVYSAYFEPPIASDGSWLIDLGSLGASGSATAMLKFSVPATTAPGLYPITITVRYYDGDTAQTVTTNAIVKVMSDSAVEVSSIAPDTLEIGKTTQLTFRLQNMGTEDISNVVFKWDTSSDYILPMGSDNQAIVSTVPAKGYVDVPFDTIVSPSITPGVYSISIQMSYYDKSGERRNTTSTAGIIVGGVTDFDLSLQSSATDSMTFYITNIGSNPGYSVIVSVPSQDGYRVSGTDSSVIGNLDAGDYTLVTLPVVKASPNAEDVMINIAYTDNLGVRRSVDKTVSVSTSGGSFNMTASSEFDPSAAAGTAGTYGTFRQRQSASNGNTLTYIVIGLGGIVAVLVLFKYRQIRKKKDHEKDDGKEPHQQQKGGIASWKPWK